MNDRPRVLPGASVLPPMDPDPPRPMPKQAGGPSRKVQQKHGDRFAVLNTFVDFTLRGFSRSELAVWLVLYRDSRDGVARTSQSDIAKRAGISI